MKHLKVNTYDTSILDIIIIPQHFKRHECGSQAVLLILVSANHCGHLTFLNIWKKCRIAVSPQVLIIIIFFFHHNQQLFGSRHYHFLYSYFPTKRGQNALKFSFTFSRTNLNSRSLRTRSKALLTKLKAPGFCLYQKTFEIPKAFFEDNWFEYLTILWLQPCPGADARFYVRIYLAGILFKVNNKDVKPTAVSLLLTLNAFHIFLYLFLRLFQHMHYW